MKLSTMKKITISIICICLLTNPIIATASSYSNNELARAVSLGIGSYQSTNSQITYAQFMKMLDNMINLTDNTKLSEWKQQLPKARKSNKKMTRYNGMLAIMYTANFLGENYTEFNNAWDSIHRKIGDVWEECIPDNDIWGKWPNQKIDSGFHNDPYTYDWSYGALAYFYSFGRMSVINKKTIFEYSNKNNSMRPDKKFTYTEALAAVLRLYDSSKPVTARYATKEDVTILNNANERKKTILNTPTVVKITGTSYYVSKDGNDNNDGLTPQTAWATIDKVNQADLRYGDGVFFRRGDLWRIYPFICKDGVTYSAYGEGEKPRIYGSQENSAGTDKWKLVNGTKNIWVYYKDMPFCGYMTLNKGERFAQKRWVYWNGTMYVQDGKNKKFNIKSLKNLEYFNDVDLTKWDNYVNSDLIVYDCPNTGKLYLRCDEGNPGSIYHSIEIAPKYEQVALIELGKGNVIDNLCLMYYGNCGIIGNGIVQNCELSYFGGANFSFIPNGNFAGGAGGGINVGTNSSGGKGMQIINNYIHESYDEGITIECGWNGEDYGEKFKDILIKNNIFEKNRHDCWISSFMEDRKGIIFQNITYDGNMFLYTGTPSCSLNRDTTPEDAGIAVNDPGERNMENIVVKNNTFYTSKSALIFIYSNQKEDVHFSDNTYVIDNNALFLTRGYDSSKYFYNFSGKAPKEYLNDLTSTILSDSFPPSISHMSKTITVGQQYTIPIENINSITKVTYKVTNGNKYIDVSPKGRISAKKPGTAKISVTFSNGIQQDITLVFTVTVKN